MERRRPPITPGNFDPTAWYGDENILPEWAKAQKRARRRLYEEDYEEEYEAPILPSRPDLVPKRTQLGLQFRELANSVIDKKLYERQSRVWVFHFSNSGENKLRYDISYEPQKPLQIKKIPGIVQQIRVASSFIGDPKSEDVTRAFLVAVKSDSNVYDYLLNLQTPVSNPRGTENIDHSWNATKWISYHTASHVMHVLQGIINKEPDSPTPSG